jgi:IS5 family transposase
LAEALIQGDEQGYFADKGLQRPSLPRDARTARSDRRRGVARLATSSARRLAEARQFLVVEHPLRRRARSRHNEAMYGMNRVRYRRLARNACHLRFVATAMNMKRALVLMQQN